MKTLIYSFGILSILLSPVTCTYDASGNLEIDNVDDIKIKKENSPNENANEHAIQKDDIDPVIIRTKP